MNKYKIISLLLAVALLASLVLTFVRGSQKVVNAEETVVQNILSRKSVRTYTNQVVPREKLDTLVRLAMAAPTGKDMRPWQFIVFDDTTQIRRLTAAMPRAAQLKQCMAAIMVVGDSTVTDNEGRTSNMWMLDCSAATENILLGAEAMGLGACWVTMFPFTERMEAMKEALELPDGIMPLCIVTIGYPKGNTEPKDKYDTDIIHYNGW